MKNKSIILLSGGLDSLVCLGLTKDEYNITLALTFDYGQKSANQEISASKELAKYYGIEHQVIELPFLKSITKTALVNDNENTDNEHLSVNDIRNDLWVPNRNGLFLNIAASYADSYDFTHIIFGANKEESEAFPDNTKEFTNTMTEVFKYSTLSNPVIVTPLISMYKNDIVKLALEKQLPLELTRSCYNNSQKNCGKCTSCILLKNALKNNGDTKYIKVLFDDAD